MLRRSLFLVAVAFLAGCSHAPVADSSTRNAIAPTGTLRVGVYSGSPTSYVKTKDGREAGLALEMGQMLGRQLGVPVRVVHFDRIALVLQAIKSGDIDFTFTNAAEERRKDFDFSPPIVRLELGYIVPAQSRLADADAVDSAGVRVGVTAGSSSEHVLSQRFREAKLVPAASLQKAVEMLKTGSIDAYATNKGILYELGDQVQGSRVLPGRWGAENLAIGYAKGRDAAAPYMARFAEQLRTSGALKDMIARAGLRGVAND
jgi:polar amino acid transport system substrate-binding protein